LPVARAGYERDLNIHPGLWRDASSHVLNSKGIAAIKTPFHAPNS
jgi:hypothetical protein